MSRFSKGFFYGLVLVAGCFFACVNSAWAYGDELLTALSTSKGNIRSGNLRLHLGLEARETYDDNIFNTAVNQKEDFITSITPGFLVTVGNRNKAELGYAVGIHSYSDYSAEDFVSQHGRAMLDLNLPSGIRVDFLDTYLKTEDPRSEELQLRASHKTNDIDASVGYEFPAQKLTIQALYGMRYLKYDQTANKSFNKLSNIVGVAAYYKFMPKTSALVEYKYAVQDYFDSVNENTDKDAKTHSVNVGLKWDPTAKLSGTIKTGWERKQYDNVRDDLGNLYLDKNLWSVEGFITYRVTEKTKFDIGLNRSLEDTEYTGSTTYSRATNYLKTGAMVGVEHKLNRKFSVNFNAGIQRHEYNKIQTTKLERKDEIGDFSVGLKYKIRDWIGVSAKFSYYNNNSDDPNRDERHNKFFVSLAAAI